jgi:hypothetical protein
MLCNRIFVISKLAGRCDICDFLFYHNSFRPFSYLIFLFKNLQSYRTQVILLICALKYSSATQQTSVTLSRSGRVRVLTQCCQGGQNFELIT